MIGMGTIASALRQVLPKPARHDLQRGDREMRKNATVTPFAREVAADGNGADTASWSVDGHAGQLRLLGLAHSAVRCALREHASEDGTRAALRELCDAARGAELRAEQLLILLKEVWRDLPEARLAAYDDGRATFTRLVTLCIREYYAPQRLQ